jgi:FtsZ-binding cell division protein ZapB
MSEEKAEAAIEQSVMLQGDLDELRDQHAHLQQEFKGKLISLVASEREHRLQMVHALISRAASLRLLSLSPSFVIVCALAS